MGTLLIIEDSSSVRAEVLRILGKKGSFTRFLQAENGVAGLKTLSEMGGDIDVVLCDLAMPLMDGFKFLRAVKADPHLSDIPVIMLTAEQDVNEVVKAFELGANDYITKPFLPAILRSRLQSMLRIKQLQDELKRQKNLLEQMATTDALTGVPNRRFFDRFLEEECRRCRRYGNNLALLMIDLDHFKEVNDTFGHSTGDAVLRDMADILKKSLRNVDLVARYGGEEFVIALPQTPCDRAFMVAERLRGEVEGHSFPGPGRITISVGFACYAGEEGLASQAVVDNADHALYQAKRKGRNRVEGFVPGAGRDPA